MLCRNVPWVKTGRVYMNMGHKWILLRPSLFFQNIFVGSKPFILYKWNSCNTMLRNHLHTLQNTFLISFAVRDDWNISSEFNCFGQKYVLKCSHRHRRTAGKRIILGQTFIGTFLPNFLTLAYFKNTAHELRDSLFRRLRVVNVCRLNDFDESFPRQPSSPFKSAANQLKRNKKTEATIG